MFPVSPPPGGEPQQHLVKPVGPSLQRAAPERGDLDGAHRPTGRFQLFAPLLSLLPSPVAAASLRHLGNWQKHPHFSHPPGKQLGR